VALLSVLPIGAPPATPVLPLNVDSSQHSRVLKYRLKSNGMPIYLSQNHAAPVVTFMVVYHVGSRNEAPGNTGRRTFSNICSVQEHSQFRQANGHKTIQELLHATGADWNMTTWYDRMNGYATLPASHLELAMKIEADRLGRGLILDEERQTEMSVVANEYEMGKQSIRGALEAVIGAAIAAHPYRWAPIGYRSDIEGVSTDKPS